MRELMSIFEQFSDFGEDDVLIAITNLPIQDCEMMEKRFGLNGNKLYSIKELQRNIKLMKKQSVLRFFK